MSGPAVQETLAERAQRLAAAEAKSAPAGETLAQRAQRLAAAEEANRPGVISRAMSSLGAGVSQAIHHPIDTAESMIVAPIKSAFDAVVAPGVGEARPDPRLSKGGNSSGRAIETTPYDAEHGGVTSKERTAAGLQTLVNVAAPAAFKGIRATALPRVGARAATGGALATIGAAGGAAYNPDDPLAGAVAGGVAAPIVGAAAGGVAKAARVTGQIADQIIPQTAKGSAVDRAASRVQLGADNAAKRDLLRQLERSRMTPERVKEIAAQVRPNEMLLDVAPSVLGRAEGAVAVPSRGAADIETALRGRVAEGPGRVQALVRQNITPGTARGNKVLTSRELIANRKAGAKQLYDKAYAAEDLDHPEIYRIFDHDQFRDAFGEAQKLAHLKGEKLPPLFKTSDVGGIEVREQVPIPVKTLDWIKRGLDAHIERKAGSGNAISRDEARELRGLLRGALARADEQRPEYGAARAQYAGDSDLLNAHQAATHGLPDHEYDAFKKPFRNVEPDALEADWPQLSEGERELYRRGAVSDLASEIDKIRDGHDPTQSFQTEAMRRRLRVIAPDQQSVNTFMQDVLAETAMHKNAQTVMSNSRTARRAGQMGDDAGAGKAIDLGVAAATGDARGMLRMMLADAKRRGSGLTESRVDALAPYLTARGQSLQQLLEELGPQLAERQVRQTNRNAVVKGVAASSAGSVPSRRP